VELIPRGIYLQGRIERGRVAGQTRAVNNMKETRSKHKAACHVLTTSTTTSKGTTTLSWHYEDRLVGITYPSTATNAFSYNAFGARVSKTDSGGTSIYARNGVSVIAPVLSDGSLTYTPGISSNDGSDSTFSHGDIKNSLTQTTSNESTSATKQYDAFGNETTTSGTWQGPFQYGGPYGYQTDHDSDLKLLGHRYYDSNTGRFLGRDPIGDGRNWYAYCQNAATARADNDGMRAFVIIYRGAKVGSHAVIVIENPSMKARREGRRWVWYSLTPDGVAVKSSNRSPVLDDLYAPGVSRVLYFYDTTPLTDAFIIEALNYQVLGKWNLLLPLPDGEYTDPYFPYHWYAHNCATLVYVALYYADLAKGPRHVNVPFDLPLVMKREPDLRIEN
jgi:RHS repeat-associated protein